VRLVRFHRDGSAGYGILNDGKITVVGGLTDHAPTGESFPAESARLLAPSVPTKIVCGGLNYRDHAAEMKLPIPEEPVIFIKPSTAVLDPGGDIICPPSSKQVEYEGELAAVIGCETKSVTPAEARKCIVGYTCLNDVTARDLQRKDGQWTRAKSFDTFCPFGPWIETEFDPGNAVIETVLNGKVVQSSNTSNLIWAVDVLVSFISQVMTLHPGDVVTTGTPPGIGPMKPGDEVEVRIAGIGSLVNKVK